MAAPRKGVTYVKGKSLPSINNKFSKRYQVFQDVINKRLLGWSDNEIKDYMMEEYGYAQPTADNLYNQAMVCFDRRLMAYSDASAEKNIKILNSLLNKCVQENDTTNSLKVIDILNKMVGAYTENVNIHSDTPIFQINVGN